MGMLGTILEYARHPLIPSFGLAHYPSKGGDLLAALRLLLMTGLRRMEALALRRDWIDARNQCIRFQDTQSGSPITAYRRRCDRAPQGLAAS